MIDVNASSLLEPEEMDVDERDLINAMEKGCQLPV
jgi:hypothetical protein